MVSGCNPGAGTVAGIKALGFRIRQTYVPIPALPIPSCGPQANSNQPPNKYLKKDTTEKDGKCRYK